MPAAHPHDTHEIPIAATLRPIRRHRQARCGKLGRLVKWHLRWLEIFAASLVCCRMRAGSPSTRCNYATF